MLGKGPVLQHNSLSVTKIRFAFGTNMSYAQVTTTPPTTAIRSWAIKHVYPCAFPAIKDFTLSTVVRVHPVVERVVIDDILVAYTIILVMNWGGIPMTASANP